MMEGARRRDMRGQKKVTEKRKSNAGESYRHHVLDAYFFLAAFSADFVTLPLVLSVLSTDLMTPTATV
jgi:hypothetical protein